MEPTLKNILARVNETVAVKMTMLFGSIWCVYLFFVFSLVPVLMPAWHNIQLVALPALMVGNAVLSRGADRRAAEDHKALLEILSDVREELADLKEKTAGIAQSTSEAFDRPETVSISDQTFVNLTEKPDTNTPTA